MTKLCFIKGEGRPCHSTCMAYTGTEGKPACALLDAVGGVTAFFLSMAKAQSAVVKHPASPPAPEVR